jgi:hypothetical protein
VKSTHTHLTKTFQGDVEGESTTNLLFAYGTGEGSAAYVDLERFVGLTHGRSGSFVLRYTRR